MVQRTLGVGIVGTGWVAGAHIDTFKKIDGCRIVAISSRKKQRTDQYIHEKDLYDAQGYDSIHDLLEHDELDIVVICTPHPNHPYETIAAARAGKHIVIEKPVAMNRQDLRRMCNEVKKARVKTSVCFELRWIGLFKNIKAMLEQGLIGRVFYGECSYFHGIGPWYGQWGWNIKKRMGGDALMTAGCHALDGLIWLMDSQVTQVAAISNKSASNKLKYEYDPNSVAILRFANGAIGTVATSIECRQPYLFPVMLQGDKGTICNDKISTLDWPGLHKEEWATVPTDLPNSGDVHDHPYHGQLKYFVDCIRLNRRPHNDLANTMHTHEVIFAVNEALKKKKMVNVKRTARR